MAHKKKRAAPAKDPARLHCTRGDDSSPSRPLYHPLTWRTATPVRIHGDACGTAAGRESQSGRIDPALLVGLVLAVVEYLLIRGAT